MDPGRQDAAPPHALAKAAGIEMFPFHVSELRTLAAAMRAAGYKSFRNYLSDHVTEARRRGQELNSREKVEYRDVLRAVCRNSVPTQQSRAARPKM